MSDSPADAFAVRLRTVMAAHAPPVSGRVLAERLRVPIDTVVGWVAGAALPAGSHIGALEVALSVPPGAFRQMLDGDGPDDDRHLAALLGTLQADPLLSARHKSVIETLVRDLRPTADDPGVYQAARPSMRWHGSAPGGPETQAPSPSEASAVEHDLVQTR